MPPTQEMKWCWRHYLALFLLKAPASPNAADTQRNRVEVAMVVAILLPALFWRMWWGGQSPPARLIAPMTPFLALWLARRWARIAQPMVRRALMVAAAWSWSLFLFAGLQPDRLLFINKRVRPTRIWDALWPGGPIDGLLPDLARPEPSDWPIALAWIAALLLATLWARRSPVKVET